VVSALWSSSLCLPAPSTTELYTLSLHDALPICSGCIRSLEMEGGDVLEGDFFIDCTGFRALLIGQALGVGFSDWSQWLPNDRALATQTTAVRDAVPYTRAIAGRAGWQWRIPLQHRVGNGIVYSSRFMDDDEAREAFLSSVEGEVIRTPWPVRFRPG